MKMTVRQKLNVVFIYFILLVCSIITLLVRCDKIDPFTKSEDATLGIGLMTFYNILNGNRMMLYCFIGLILLIPSISCIHFYKYEHNKFAQSIKVRIGIHRYKRHALFRSFFYGAAFMSIFLISLLVCVHIFYIPIVFQSNFEYKNYFSNNALVNLVIYILFSSIGLGIYNMFLVSGISFIKNEYVYRVSSLIHLVISLLIYIGCGPILSSVFETFGKESNTSFVLASFFIPLNLITPGQFQEAEGYLSFFISVVFYLLFIYILYKLSIRKELSNE